MDAAALVLDGSARCIVKDNEIKLPLVAGTRGLQRQGGGQLKLARSETPQTGDQADKGDKGKQAPDAVRQQPVAVCWSDSDGNVRAVKPVDCQRLALGSAHMSLEVALGMRACVRACVRAGVRALCVCLDPRTCHSR